MNSFTYEEQGEKNYLVYEKAEEDRVDTLTLEMMSNNKIDGVVPANHIQIDDKFYMKYDITGLTSLRDYLQGVVGRQKILSVLESIAAAAAVSEDYMLNISSYVLDMEYVYIDSETLKISMIVLPVLRDEVKIEVFLKELFMGLRYDQTEDCGYVASLLNLLGGSGAFSIRALQEEINQLKKEGNSQTQWQAPKQKSWDQQKNLQENAAARLKNTQLQAPQRQIQDQSSDSQPFVRNTKPQSYQQGQPQITQPQSYWQNVRQAPQTGRNGIGLSEEDRKKIVQDLKREKNLDILFSDEEESVVKKEKKGFFFRKDKPEKEKKPEKGKKEEKTTEKKSLWEKLTGKKESLKKDSVVESPLGGFDIPGIDIPGHNRGTKETMVRHLS